MDGVIRFSDEINSYPLENNGRSALIYVTNSIGFSLTGSGTIDGQGLKWWRYAYSGVDQRPILIEFITSRSLEINGISLLNSPKWSVSFNDCADIIVHDITIFIDSSVTRVHDRSSVTYALNTDGIDISATNVTLYNNNITNYDDAIVVKPCRSNWVYCQCSGAVFAYNNTIAYSTGLAIGSVPPNEAVNCVRNVTFANSRLIRPLKALYLKSNPGISGTGIIEDITYTDITIQAALWWTIWMGPQQQNQPGDDNQVSLKAQQNCAIYPLDCAGNMRRT